MRRLAIALLVLLLASQSSAQAVISNAALNSVTVGGAAAGGCVGDHCAPGSQAMAYNSNTDYAFADTGAALGKANMQCAYYRPTGSIASAQAHVPYTLRNTGTEVMSAWFQSDNRTWPTAAGGMWYNGVGYGDGLTYTGQTTNIYALCQIAFDGVGEVAGGRVLLFEETSADNWTTRSDVAVAGAQSATVADAEWLIGNGSDVVAPNPAEILYFWSIDQDLGIDYDNASVITEIKKYLGCSIDPASANVKNMWSMTSSSTATEPNNVSGGTSLSLTSITRNSRSAIWTNGGSGEATLCDD